MKVEWKDVTKAVMWGLWVGRKVDKKGRKMVVRRVGAMDAN